MGDGFVRSAESSTVTQHAIPINMNITECAHAASESLFGALSSLDVTLGSTSIFIVVFCVIVCEKIFHASHILTVESPFHTMVLAIEKEMMIVGCMAFFFKIIVGAANNLAYSWVHALEYAGERANSHHISPNFILILLGYLVRRYSDSDHFILLLRPRIVLDCNIH